MNIARENEDRERMRRLVQQYGWNSTCYQLVNPGFRYWFSARRDAGIGFVDYVGVRVVGGAPVCAESDLDVVVSEFEAEALREKRRVCYFASEARLEACLKRRKGYSTVQLGAQPVWMPARLVEKIHGKPSLRMQLHRARNKGLVTSEWDSKRAAEDPDLRRVLSEWLSTRGLPSLHFLVEPQTLSDLQDRRVFVAQRAGQVVGFLVASPIPERSGWLVEQFVRGSGAINGTIEILLLLAAETFASEGAEYLTLGLSPLSHAAGPDLTGTPPLIRFFLGWARAHGSRFYNFEGLEFFKTKFEPDTWEPIYAICNQSNFSPRFLYAIACAFTQGHPIATLIGGLGKALNQEARWLAKR